MISWTLQWLTPALIGGRVGGGRDPLDPGHPWEDGRSKRRDWVWLGPFGGWTRKELLSPPNYPKKDTTYQSALRSLDRRERELQADEKRFASRQASIAASQDRKNRSRRSRRSLFFTSGSDLRRFDL